MNSALLRLYHVLPAPVASMAATMYGVYLRYWRYGWSSSGLARDAQAREHWTSVQWEAWREERLAYILERAATRVPYYREQWEARRRRGDRASWDQLENWPILEKESVRQAPLAFVADDHNVRRMFHLRTGGTTGTPLDVWRSRRTVETLYGIGRARTRGWHGMTLRDRRAMLGGQLVIPTQQRQPPFWVWNAALHQLYMSSYHLAPDLIPAYLDALVEHRIRYLTGYSSSLYALAQEAIRLGRRDLRMRVALTSAEPLLDYQRQAIAEAFQCPVRETYGMGETVAAATECEAGRLHLWPEVGVLEVSDHGVPVPAGEIGEFICTGLLNPDMPLIRYRVGDSGRLAPPEDRCSCGRTLPILAGIDGRTTDMLLTRDGRRVFWLNPVLYELPIREAQIVQEQLQLIRVRYVPAPGFDQTSESQLIERIRARLGPVQVVLEQVPAIPRTPAGKSRAVVCNIPAAEREEILSHARASIRAT